uniref:Uncharacterized protein n=1 Tax=Arion vulgaris TaxID=1028688 RepID=A0A0B7AAS8_9EUPU
MERSVSNKQQCLCVLHLKHHERRTLYCHQFLRLMGGLHESSVIHNGAPSPFREDI